jgi:hypothetical protein
MITVFWDVTPCGFVDRYQSTRRQIPEDGGPDTYDMRTSNLVAMYVQYL